MMRPRAKAHYQENKSYYRERNNRKRAQLTQLIRAMKSAPCADCKQTFPHYVMDFDHVRGEKRFVISRGAREGTNVLEEELRKCDLVCSNCHRIRTHERSARRGARTPDIPGH